MLPLLVQLACSGPPTPAPTLAPAGPPPNLVLVVWESTRADHTTVGGYPLRTTPTLSRLAQSGVVFEQQLSAAPWTHPSVSSLLTGLSPVAHGVRVYEDVLGDPVETLAERLKARGYATAFVGSNTFFEGPNNLAQGFDSWFGVGDVSGPELLVKVDDFLDARPADQPFFLYLHLFEPHCPYDPPAEFAGGFVQAPGEASDRRYPAEYWEQMFGCFRLPVPGREGPPVLELAAYLAAYDAELRTADMLTGQLLEELDQRRLLQDSLLVVTADHGEAFYEHGDHGHGRQLYQESVRVPLVVSPPWPGPEPAPWVGRRVVAATSALDVPATLLAAAGASLDGIEGVDLSPAWSPAGPPPEWAQRALFSATDHEAFQRAVVQDGWKLIVDVRPAEPDPDLPGAFGSLPRPPELYDLRADPEEKANRAGQPDQSERQAALLDQVARHEAAALEQAGRMGATRRELDQETKQALKRLGYLE